MNVSDTIMLCIWVIKVWCQQQSLIAAPGDIKGRGHSTSNAQEPGSAWEYVRTATAQESEHNAAEMAGDGKRT